MTNVTEITVIAEIRRPERRSFQLTHMGNAERFMATYGQDVKYCTQNKAFYVWDGLRWKQDDLLTVQKWLGESTRSMFAEAARMERGEQRDALISWEKQSESNQNQAGTLAQIKVLTACTRDIFNTNTWLLNFQNGTMNLKTGDFYKARREDYITTVLPYHHDEMAEVFGAQCPLWLKFLNEAFPDEHAEVIPFIQRALGYSLTGNTSEKCLFLMQGDTDCGKTMFANVLQFVLGEYAMSSDWQTFSAHRTFGLEIREDIARLADARCVVISEGDKGIRWSEGLVKKLTGNNKVTARKMRENSVDYTPQFKLWFDTNFLPKASNDDAFWNRIRLIKFTVQIPKERQDTGLTDKLKAEAPGIFAWALQGCLQWVKLGNLNAPPKVLNATQEYRAEVNEVGIFLDEYCVVDPDKCVGKRELWKRYQSASTEDEVLGFKDFNAAIEKLGFREHRNEEGMVWKRLAFNNERSVGF